MDDREYFLADRLLSQLKGDPLPWLLKADDDNPGVRFFSLRDLLDLAQDDPQVIAAQQRLMQNGLVPVILSHQREDGTWERGQGCLQSQIFQYSLAGYDAGAAGSRQ